MIFNDTLPHTKKYWPFLEGHKRAIHYNKDLFNDNTLLELPAHITHTALAYRDQLNNNKK
jgi:hypothetical protein